MTMKLLFLNLYLKDSNGKKIEGEMKYKKKRTQKIELTHDVTRLLDILNDYNKTLS